MQDQLLIHNMVCLFHDQNNIQMIQKKYHDILNINVYISLIL
jgi:hypothetical protein